VALQYLVQTNAQRKLGGLEYKGDIKAYLTEFRALKIFARCMGESLQEKINLVMPQAIIDMRFAHHLGEFVDDEHFEGKVEKARCVRIFGEERSNCSIND